jgi:microcompartment protein CcmK/EutM
MQFGIVLGSVVSTQKVRELEGLSLKVLGPCDAHKKHYSDPLVAYDPIGARVGDLVMWVSKREASLAILKAPLVNSYPVDAAITGIIDVVS